MKIRDFLNKFDKVLNELKSQQEIFSENMYNINNSADRPFAEWVLIYLAWSELGSFADIEAHYGKEGENVQE